MEGVGPSALTTPDNEYELTPMPLDVTPPITSSPPTMSYDGRRKRVGFTSDITPPTPDEGSSGQRHFDDAAQTSEDKSSGPSTAQTERPMSGAGHGAPDLPEDAVQDIYQIFSKAGKQPLLPPPQPAKPVLRKSSHTPDVELEDLKTTFSDPGDHERHQSGKNAHERASRLAAKVGSYNASAAPSRSGSVDGGLNLAAGGEMSHGEIERERSSEESDADMLYQKPHRPTKTSMAQANEEAFRLVRAYTHRNLDSHYDFDDSPLHSGQVTPVVEQAYAEDYVPKPAKYRGGILSSLIQLAGGSGVSNHTTLSLPTFSRHEHSRSVDDMSLAGTTPLHTPSHSPTASGTSTPVHGQRKKSRLPWPHMRHGSESPKTLSALIGSSLNLAASSKEIGEEEVRKYKQRPGIGKKNRSSDALHNVLKKVHYPYSKRHNESRITKHIAETIARHRYIEQLCKALMDFGAPTHRLEEYLKATSRQLEIEAQFLYIPGCMLISFDDPTTHTAEVKLVRRDQGVDLGKLRDTHQIYKEVIHDKLHVENAMSRLEAITKRKSKFPIWARILIHGLAAASVGPFAFQANLIDLPVAFGLGCLLGFLQLKVSPKSDLYANVFEIFAAVLTSFLARAVGSIRYPGGGERIFCFSALAQSSIALILPGYTVLCASLELQSRSIVAGSVRMVYAIIYSLFLGYGITIGTVIWGWIYHDAVSDTTCKNPMQGHWFFFFVPVFTMCLIMINQAKWKQAPVMLVIAFVGYLVNFYTSKRFIGNAQVTQTFGALAIGIMANLYARLGPSCENIIMRFWLEYLQVKFCTKKQQLEEAASSTLKKLSSAENGQADYTSAEKEKMKEKPKRTWKERKGYGMAAAAMLPAIFVQVPSGLAVSGSLVSGITSANQIVNNQTGTTTVSSGLDSLATNGAAFTVSLSVIQIAIGITVGLFISAILVYPFGKRRSGLFSF